MIWCSRSLTLSAPSISSSSFPTHLFPACPPPSCLFPLLSPHSPSHVWAHVQEALLLLLHSPLPSVSAAALRFCRRITLLPCMEPARSLQGEPQAIPSHHSWAPPAAPRDSPAPGSASPCGAASAHGSGAASAIPAGDGRSGASPGAGTGGSGEGHGQGQEGVRTPPEPAAADGLSSGGPEGGREGAREPRAHPSVDVGVPAALVEEMMRG